MSGRLIKFLYHLVKSVNNDTLKKEIDEYQRDDLKIFSGNTNRKLAEDCCRHLGVPLGAAKVTRFSNKEIEIEILENVRSSDVFVIQSVCSAVNPDVISLLDDFKTGSINDIYSVIDWMRDMLISPNDSLTELLLIIDALKRSSASRITAVLPYYGYARQDKKVKSRVPISAKLVADEIQTAGAKRVIGLDFHSNQIQGFFNIPADNLFAMKIVADDIINVYSIDPNRDNTDELVIVSPDAGGVERARALAKRLNADLAIIDKRRPAPNQAKAMAVIGNVRNKRAVIFDDIIDTAGTLVEAEAALKKEGAIEVGARCVHAELSGPAIQRIKDSSIDDIAVTDSIPLKPNVRECDKIRVLPAGKLIAEAIIRSYRGDSVNDLFN